MEADQTDTLSLREIRSAPEVLNAAFDFLRLNIRPIIKGLLLYVFPYITVALLLFHFVVVGFIGQVFATLPHLTYTNFPGLLSTGSRLGDGMLTFASLAFYLVGVTFLIAFVYAFVNVYVRSAQPEVNLSEVWGETKRLFGKVLGTNIGLGLIGIGFFLLFILIIFTAGAISSRLAVLLILGSIFASPILFVTYALYYPVRFLEGSRFADSFNRSWRLITGQWWRTCGLMVTCFGLMTALSAFIRLPATLLQFLAGLNIITVKEYDLMNPFSLWSLVLAIVGIVFETAFQLVGVAFLLCLALQYYSQVERQESAALLEQVGQIGAREESAMKSRTG